MDRDWRFDHRQRAGDCGLLDTDARQALNEDQKQELYAFFAQERATVDRLHNWGAWAKDRIVRRTCFSLEGRYRPEKDDADRIAEIRVDMRDALKVAKALSRMPVAIKASHALTAWFVDGYREQAFSSHMRAHQYPTSRREIASVMRDSILVARNRIKTYNPRN